MSLTPAYTERLGVPLRWWVQGTMLVATLWLAVVVAMPAPVAWLVTGVALALLVVCLWAYGGARIVVDDGAFRAGRAHIDAAHLGAATPLDAEQTRRTAGVGRRRPRLPAAAALPQARGPGGDHRPGRPGAVLAGRAPATPTSWPARSPR